MDCFTIDTMKQTAEKRCRCGGIARRGQRNCHLCHALANRIFRARVKHQAEKLEKVALMAIAIARRLDAALKK